MSVLGRFPQWLRWLLLTLNLTAATGVLIANWTATFPNLIASWELAAAAAAIALPAGAWLGRWLDQHHADHHAETRAHITAELAPLHQAVAELHAKLDRQQTGGEQ